MDNETTAIEAISWQKNVKIDCELAFPDATVPQTPGTSLDMRFVGKLRSDDDITEFIPSGNIYLREEVISTIKELTEIDRDWCQILIGSPGVGKSVLLFLVAFFQASVNRKAVLYIRKTEVPNELVSAFYIRPDSCSTKRLQVIVDAARDIDKIVTVYKLEKYLGSTYTGSQYSVHKKLRTKQHALVFLDGLKQESEDLKNFTSYHYLTTSAGHDAPSGEQSQTMDIVTLSAWKKEDLRSAISDSLHLLPPSPTRRTTSASREVASPGALDACSPNNNLQENGEGMQGGAATMGGTNTPTPQQLTEDNNADERFEEVYFYVGGRIREAIAFLRDKQKWIRKKRRMLASIDMQEAKLAVTDTKSNASEKSLDRRRTMFLARGSPGSHQIVDSQFFARELGIRLGPESFFNAYQFAKEKKLMTAAGCHFEELLHECFKRSPPPPVQEVIQAVGSGADGVSKLARHSAYWIPSISNFANIDAAFVDANAKLYCIQYTVSKTHPFNTTTFRAKFLRPLRQHISFEEEEVEILFVVPGGIQFTIPDAAQEWSCSVISIDCSSIERVLELPFPFLERNTRP